MASWRPGITFQVQADFDELVDATTEFASGRIATAGHFAPFAVAVFVNGHIQAVQPYDAQPASQLGIDEQLDALWQALAELKDSLRAVAVTVAVTLPEENRDAIQMTAEHQEGTAIGLVFRYTVGANRIPLLETPSAYEEDPHIWID